MQALLLCVWTLACPSAAPPADAAEPVRRGRRDPRRRARTHVGPAGGALCPRWWGCDDDRQREPAGRVFRRRATRPQRPFAQRRPRPLDRSLPHAPADLAGEGSRGAAAQGARPGVVGWHGEVFASAPGPRQRGRRGAGPGLRGTRRARARRALRRAHPARDRARRARARLRVAGAAAQPVQLVRRPDGGRRTGQRRARPRSPPGSAGTSGAFSATIATSGRGCASAICRATAIAHCPTWTRRSTPTSCSASRASTPPPAPPAWRRRGSWRCCTSGCCARSPAIGPTPATSTGTPASASRAGTSARRSRLAQRALIGIAATPELQPSPEAGAWAKWLLDRGLDEYVALTRNATGTFRPASPTACPSRCSPSAGCTSPPRATPATRSARSTPASTAAPTAATPRAVQL